MALPLTTLVPIYTDPTLPAAFTKREAVHVIVVTRRGWRNKAIARAKPNRHARQRVKRAACAEYAFERQQDDLWLVMHGE